MTGVGARYMTISPPFTFGRFNGCIVVGVLYAVGRPIVIPIVVLNRVSDRVSNRDCIVKLTGVEF